MSDDTERETDTDRDGTDGVLDERERGVEFGTLADRLEAHDYPTTTAELLAAYGDHELELPGGSRTLRAVLAPRRGGDGTETFDSPAAVREAVLATVGADAVGREGYSDRGAEAADEADDRSF